MVDGPITGGGGGGLLVVVYGITHNALYNMGIIYL